MDTDARRVGQTLALQDNVLGYNARSQLTDITSSVPGADYRIHYDYDAFGNRKKVSTGFTNDIGDNKAIDAHTITYDWAGNHATDNGETYYYDALGRLASISTSAGQTGYRYYDGASRVIESRDGNEVQLNDYDAGGRLVVQRTQGQSDRVQHSVVRYAYHGELGYLASYTAQGASGAKLQTTVNTVDVLRDTRLTSLTTVRNDGETAYKTSEMQYNLAGTMTAVTARNYKDGVGTVDNANSRSMIGDYAGHVLEKTQYGLRTHTLMADDEMIGYSSAAYESFSSVHEGLSAASNADVGVYVVQSATETLTSIARTIWGDERLWYLIADANGLTMANGALTVGQSLKIPAKAGATYNGAETFKPYDAGAIVGKTTPEMALPVPQQSRGGCGGLGQLVMVVVAVVATIYTAGAAASALGASGGAWSAGVAVMQGTAAGTIGTAGAIAAGAIGGAAGSIASQAVGIAIGAQDGFNWKGVALSAVGGGVSAGVASASTGTALGAKDIAGAVGRAALSNTISQGVGIVTGLQNGFSWRSVAASAAGAAAGYGAAEAVHDVGMRDLFKQTVSGMAAGATTAIARGGKFEVVRVATDAFGNALGNSLAGMGSQSDDGQQPDRVSKSISREQAERNMYGGLTSRQLLGGDKDWLSALGAYDGPYGASGNDERIPNFHAPIPQVVVDGGDVNNRLNAIFGLTPKNIGPVQAQPTQIDSLAAAAASDRRFYASRESGASNGYSAAAWHIGGLLNAVGYDLAKTARGAFQLVTDSNTQAAAYNALKFAANNPGVIANNAIQGFKDFANGPFAEQADSVFKFGAGGLATAGIGKVGVLAVDGAITGATATAKWLAPKAGQLLENYMYRTGALAYAVEPGGTYQNIVGRVPGRILSEADALNPGALGDDLTALPGTFSGGRYATMALEKPLTVYRAWTPGQSREFGAFWSLEEPVGSLQTRIDSALLPEWGNIRGTSFRAQASQYTIMELPAGTTIHIGEVGSQGGNWVGGGSQLLIEGGPQDAWKIGQRILK